MNKYRWGEGVCIVYRINSRSQQVSVGKDCTKSSPQVSYSNSGSTLYADLTSPRTHTCKLWTMYTPWHVSMHYTHVRIYMCFRCVFSWSVLNSVQNKTHAIVIDGSYAYHYNDLSIEHIHMTHMNTCVGDLILIHKSTIDLSTYHLLPHIRWLSEDSYVRPLCVWHTVCRHIFVDVCITYYIGLYASIFTTQLYR